MTSNEFPFSENYRLAGEIWADLEAAAQLLEETKSAIMAQRQSMLGEMPVNRAEQTVKASLEWEEHLKTIVEARKKANLAKVALKVAEMEYYQNQAREANARAEIRMLGDTP